MLGTDLLLALDEDSHANWWLPIPRLECRRVNGDTRLVICCAPAKKTAVALCRLERGRLPEFLVSRRLNVVMGVQQYCWRPHWAAPGTEHRRMRAVNFKHSDTSEPSGL